MFLEKDFPPDPRVENEAMSLIEEGYEVHLFSLNYKKGLPKKETINGIHLHRYQVGRITYKLSALAYTLPFFRWIISPLIKGFINQVKPDILHVHDMVIAEAVMKVNNKNKPVILDLHENRPAIMEQYKHTNVFPGKYLIDLKRWHQKQDELIRKADNIIVVTEEAAEYYTNRTDELREKFIAVPNTIKLEVFENYPIDYELIKRFDDNFCILYLGDTGLRRGTMTAIEALVHLKEKISNIKLILVGESSADPQLRSRAGELGVTDYVAFEGWQDLSLFPSYIKGADICISPILRNLHHDTTYANKIFQYMALGKPIVVSECPPQAKVVEENDCGLIHTAGDAIDLTKKIIDLAENEKERVRMGQNASLAIVKNWHWNLKSRDLIELYGTM